MSDSYISYRFTPRAKWTTAQKQAIIDEHPFCAYCGQDDYSELIVEHIEALSGGGSNHKSNLTVACKSCNSRKFSYSIESFYHQCLYKRDEERKSAISRIWDIRAFRKGRPTHYMHTEYILETKLLQHRRLHSYYTRIINSIQTNKFKIF